MITLVSGLTWRVTHGERVNMHDNTSERVNMESNSW